jgi:hypothetical protein
MRPWPRRVNRFSTSPAERGCLRRYPRDRHQGQASRRLEGSRLGVRAGRPRRGDGDRRRLRRRNFGRNRGAVFRKRDSSTSPSRQVAVARRNLLPESHGRRSSSPSTVTPTSRLLGRSSRPSKTSSTHGSGPSPSRTVCALARRVSSIPPGGRRTSHCWSRRSPCRRCGSECERVSRFLFPCALSPATRCGSRYR